MVDTEAADGAAVDLVVEAGSEVVAVLAEAAASAALGEAVPEAVAPAAAGSGARMQWFLTRKSTSS